MSDIDQPPVDDRAAAVYVHFPYCARKCPYCDFNAHALPHDDQNYADAIIAELAHRGAELFLDGGVRSIFFGGGTPSRWAPTQVGRVIDAIEAKFGFAPDVEITLEANPGTVVGGHAEAPDAEAAGRDRFEAYVAAGVGRFSIGVQSLIDRELVGLGRIHDAQTGIATVAAARSTGARVSLDVMYGFPGQSWTSVAHTLDQALALGTEHISAYALTVEPNTVLGRQAALGRFVPMPDDDQADLMERVHARLEAAGLRRYEVSNYAAPGAESRHNCIYWLGGPYLGLGAGAHSYLPDAHLETAVRRENRRAPEGYLRGASDRTFPVTFEEHLDRRQIVADRLLTVMRTRWGLDLNALDAAVGARGTLDAALRPALESMIARGLVEYADRRFRPTDRGFMFNDTLARQLRGQLDSADNPPQLQGVG